MPPHGAGSGSALIACSISTAGNSSRRRRCCPVECRHESCRHGKLPDNIFLKEPICIKRFLARLSCSMKNGTFVKRSTRSRGWMKLSQSIPTVPTRPLRFAGSLRRMSSSASGMALVNRKILRLIAPHQTGSLFWMPMSESVTIFVRKSSVYWRPPPRQVQWPTRFRGKTIIMGSGFDGGGCIRIIN